MKLSGSEGAGGEGNSTMTEMNHEESDDELVSPERERQMRRYSPNVQTHYKELRRNMTPMESVLWSKLRNRQVEGVKFRRQHPIQSFVLDFYAPEIRLAIEVNGDVHTNPDQQRKDAFRTARLAELRISVYRVTNQDIGMNVDEVVANISLEIARLRAIEGCS